MKYLLLLFAVYWAVLFVTFVLGIYEPNKFSLGIALIQSSMLFAMQAMSID